MCVCIEIQAFGFVTSDFCVGLGVGLFALGLSRWAASSWVFRVGFLALYVSRSACHVELLAVGVRLFGCWLLALSFWLLAYILSNLLTLGFCHSL